MLEGNLPRREVSLLAGGWVSGASRARSRRKPTRWEGSSALLVGGWESEALRHKPTHWEGSSALLVGGWGAQGHCTFYSQKIINFHIRWYFYVPCISLKLFSVNWLSPVCIKMWSFRIPASLNELLHFTHCFQIWFLPCKSIGVDASSILARSGKMHLIQPGSPCEPLYADHPHRPGSRRQTHCVLYGSKCCINFSWNSFHLRHSFSDMLEVHLLNSNLK